MWRIDLDALIDTLLTLALIVIWTLIIVIPGLFLTNSIIYIVIMVVIGGIFIGLINFYKEPINDYLRSDINKTKNK